MINIGRLGCLGFLILFIISCSNNQRGKFKAKDITNNKCIVIQEKDITQYVGKLIELEGYISYGFEEGAIYGSLKDLEKLHYQNALWLCPTFSQKNADSIDNYFNDIERKMNKKKVVLTGYIDTSISGHNGYYKGCFNYFNIRYDKIEDCSAFSSLTQ